VFIWPSEKFEFETPGLNWQTIVGFERFTTTSVWAAVGAYALHSLSQVFHEILLLADQTLQTTPANSAVVAGKALEVLHVTVLS